MKAFSFILLILLVDCTYGQDCSRLNPVITPSGTLVAAENRTYFFWCTDSTTMSVNFEWYINGTPFSDLNFTNIFVNPSNSISFLKIDPATSDLSPATIDCNATYENGCLKSAQQALLDVQGSPSAATNLQGIFYSTCMNDSQISLSWNASQAKKIYQSSGTYYDIQITNSMLDLNIDISNYTETELTVNFTNYTCIDVNCADFNVTIVSRNLAGKNSVSKLQATHNNDSIKLELQVIKYNIHGDFFIYHYVLDPAVCNLSILYYKENNEAGNMLMEHNLEVNTTCSTNTTLAVSTMDTEIVHNNYYILEFNLRNSGSKAKLNHTISTFDIQQCDIYFTNSTNTDMNIFVQYVENTLAMGAMLIVSHRCQEEKQISFMNFKRSSKSYMDVYQGCISFSNGTAFVFDIESDGLLQTGKNRPAIDSISVDVSLHKDHKCNSSDDLGKCDIHSIDNFTVEVHCKCSDHKAIGYLIAMVDSLNNLFVNYTKKCSSNVIMEISNGRYNLAAFYIQRNIGISGSAAFFTSTLNIPPPKISIGKIVGPVLAVVVLLICLVAVVIGLCWLNKDKVKPYFSSIRTKFSRNEVL